MPSIGTKYFISNLKHYLISIHNYVYLDIVNHDHN